jgi:hypothetical protein
VRDVIRYVGAPHTLPSHSSVAAALAASRAESRQPVETEQANGLALLRERACNQPDTLRTRPLIAGTIDELRERYELSGSDAAVTLLRRSSQRYNLKLHTLALAFLSAPPARPGQPRWSVAVIVRRRHRSPSPRRAGNGRTAEAVSWVPYSAARCPLWTVWSAVYSSPTISWVVCNWSPSTACPMN